MIISVTEAGGGEKSALAARLAAERALVGRKVLLLGADASGATAPGVATPGVVTRSISAKGLQPELEHLSSCYHDIVIDTEDRDSLGSRSALNAARVVVVPLVCCDGEAGLIERIAKARRFNPGLRVLLVLGATPDVRAHALAARIPDATLIGDAQLYGAVFG
ncbi:chromosome partitioning protein [Oxalobacteraceae bacterium GrIS 1.11]